MPHTPASQPEEFQKDETIDYSPLPGGTQTGGAEARPPVSPSVIQALQARSDSIAGITLESGEGEEDAPVIISDEARQLRDLIGRYQILGELGRGGVGIVLKGRDGDLGRDVAMKVLRDDYKDRPDLLARFVEEAQIGGQLQHPGIVPVYELGVGAGGRPYFAMKLIKGETLAAKLNQRRSPDVDRRTFLGIFEQVCQTMGYAHSRRVVHRDLKPANVMIGAFGEVQVVDWGFAKVLPKGGVADEENPSEIGVEHRSVIQTVRTGPTSGSQSMAGSVMGTPAYMPPEQALGRTELLDQRSDVFGLGAILCEILTGSPPYRKQDGDLLMQAAGARLDSAFERLDACGADEPMIALCKQCLAPERRDRPENAKEVAERVSAHLTSVEERAREAQLAATRAHYRQRTTIVSAIAAVLVLGLAAGAWIRVQQIREVQRDELMQQVSSAMSETSSAAGKAETAALDLGLWDDAVALAEKLVELAAANGVEPAAREQARSTLEQIQANRAAAATESARLQRDRLMVERLEQLRVPVDEDIISKNWLQDDLVRLDSEYAAAFAAYLDCPSILEAPFETALAGLQSGDIEIELATSLDHWSLVRDGVEPDDGTEPPDPQVTARIRRLAAQLDPEHAWRNELRSLLPEASSRGEELRELADRADLAGLSAAGCRLLAEALWRAGDTETGLEVLRRGLERHPQDFDLCFRLAIFHERLEHWQEALDVYAVARALQPHHLDVRHRRGLTFEKLGDTAGMRSVFEDLLAEDPGNAHWLGHLGDACRVDGDTDGAIEIYERALERSPDDTRILCNLGLVLLDARRHEEAMALSQRALALDEHLSTAYLNLGIAQIWLRRFDEAIDNLNRSLEEGTGNPALVYYNLGFALQGKQKHAEAIEMLKRSLEDDPGRANSHSALGTSYRALGDSAKAIASFRAALETSPDLVSALTGLAVCLTEQGEIEEARTLLERAIEIDPEDANLVNCLATCYPGPDQLARRVSILQRALEIDPGCAQAWYNLGQAAWEAGRPQDALEPFEKAVECFRASNEISDREDWIEKSIVNVCGTLLQIGRPDEALERIEAAIEEMPDGRYLHWELAAIQAGRGDDEAALASYRRAIEIDPGFPDARNRMGSTLVRLFRIAEARATFRSLLEEAPDMAPARNNLGDIEFMAGNYLASRAEFEKAQELFGKGKTPFERFWAQKVADRIEEIDRVLETGRRIVAGERVPDTVDELAAAIDVALGDRAYARAVEITEQAIDTGLEPDSMKLWGAYDSARAALLQAAGDPGLDGAGRARLRALALAWLTREVDVWTQWKTGSGLHEGRARMARCLEEDDLASVRGDSLEALPEEERAAWQAFWQRVESLATGDE